MSALQLFNNRADYSLVEGSNLPFEFELDTEKSILDPPEGINQKFVYNVTAKGKESAGLKDLSYFLLSISPSITIEDIINPTMTLNGNVYHNGELSIVDDRNDNGSYGLKVLFKPTSLSKLKPTVFTFAFELANAVGIGPIDLLVKGGSQLLNTLKIGGPVVDEMIGRDTVIYRRIEVCTPVEITPIVRHGCVTTYSCGSPIVSTIPCSGSSQKCKFYVRQNMRVRIPLSYSVTAVVSASTTDFGLLAGDTVTETNDFIEDTGCKNCTEETTDL